MHELLLASRFRLRWKMQSAVWVRGHLPDEAIALSGCLRKSQRPEVFSTVQTCNMLHKPEPLHSDSRGLWILSKNPSASLDGPHEMLPRRCPRPGHLRRGSMVSIVTSSLQLRTGSSIPTNTNLVYVPQQLMVQSILETISS